VRRLCALAVSLVLALVLAGCGGGRAADPATSLRDVSTCPTQSTTSFAKTKFVLHAGLAAGVFHRYLYRPFREGRFASGSPGRLGAFVKGAAAAAFVKREVRLALDDVRADPSLCRAVAGPLSRFGGVGSIGDKIKRGDTSGIDDAEASLQSYKGASKGQGVDIPEQESGDGFNS